jgi:xylulokinase
MELPIVMSEGGAKSRLWRQIVCDMLEAPGVFMKNTNGAPFGNAVLAGVATGVFKDFNITKDWCEVEDRTDPIPANSEIYKKYYDIFVELYERNKDLYVDLSKIRDNH